ncbi:hypothetical protein RHSIM_Rhsim03G0058900 [Rhododendron simsii]|uniref:Uncharacterized protein n=1 Tax=Rhododendron simsii TaxID=118357 RepID=A0A834H812_RHOSS|nr:hypothetical protein RHSIM_Rhsim03G0058900 [Rhododendron simsii]
MGAVGVAVVQDGNRRDDSRELMGEFRLESSLSLSGPVDLSETNNEWISLTASSCMNYATTINTSRCDFTNLRKVCFNQTTGLQVPMIRRIDIVDDLMPGNLTFEHMEQMTAEEKLDAEFDATFDVDIYPRNSEIRNTVGDICLVGYKFMDLDLSSFLFCPRLKRFAPVLKRQRSK